jgi:hypothetical protein
VARVLSEGRERDSGSLTVLVFKFDLSILDILRSKIILL